MQAGTNSTPLLINEMSTIKVNDKKNRNKNEIHMNDLSYKTEREKI